MMKLLQFECLVFGDQQDDQDGDDDEDDEDDAARAAADAAAVKEANRFLRPSTLRELLMRLGTSDLLCP